MKGSTRFQRVLSEGATFTEIAQSTAKQVVFASFRHQNNVVGSTDAPKHNETVRMAACFPCHFAHRTYRAGA